jgi:two-component system sensor histidine kinase ChvG
MSADLPYRPRRRFSALTRRILFFNAIALLILLGGVLWVQSNRIGLVEERIAGIRDQALVVAGALAEYTADADRRAIEPMQAEPLLRQLISPTHLRARVYSTVGRLQIDTRNLLARNLVTTEILPPPAPSNPFTAFFDRSITSVERLYDGLMGVRPLAHIEPYFEAGQNGRVYSEVNQALMGETGSSVRVNEQDKLVLSVAVPIRRFATLYGVLMLTTESGDIDDILKAERTALVEVFLVAFAALLFSAVYLAGFIAAPILGSPRPRASAGRAGRDAIPTLMIATMRSASLRFPVGDDARALRPYRCHRKLAADVSHERRTRSPAEKRGGDAGADQGTAQTANIWWRWCATTSNGSTG